MQVQVLGQMELISYKIMIEMENGTIEEPLGTILMKISHRDWSRVIWQSQQQAYVLKGVRRLLLSQEALEDLGCIQDDKFPSENDPGVFTLCQGWGPVNYYTEPEEGIGCMMGVVGRDVFALSLPSGVVEEGHRTLHPKAIVITKDKGDCSAAPPLQDPYGNWEENCNGQNEELWKSLEPATEVLLEEFWERIVRTAELQALQKGGAGTIR